MNNALKDGLVAYYPLQSNAVNMVDGVAGTIKGTASWVKNQAGKVVLDDTTALISHASLPINTVTYWKDGCFYAVLNGMPYMIDEALSSSFINYATATKIGGRMADHAWDFDAAYLSGTTLADLGSNATKWNLTRRNSAGLGTLIFNGVTYPCGTFDGVNQSWQTAAPVASLASAPFIMECFIIKNTSTGVHFAIAQRNDSTYPIIQVSGSYNEIGTFIKSSAITTESSAYMTTNIATTYLVHCGIGIDKKAFTVLDDNILIANDAIPSFFTTVNAFSIGAWANTTRYFFNGKIGRVSIHKNLTQTAAELAAASQQRYADYIAGNVVEWKKWEGL